MRPPAASTQLLAFLRSGFAFAWMQMGPYIRDTLEFSQRQAYSITPRAVHVVCGVSTSCTRRAIRRHAIMSTSIRTYSCCANGRLPLTVYTTSADTCHHRLRFGQRELTEKECPERREMLDAQSTSAKEASSKERRPGLSEKQAHSLTRHEEHHTQ